MNIIGEYTHIVLHFFVEVISKQDCHNEWTITDRSCHVMRRNRYVHFIENVKWFDSRSPGRFDQRFLANSLISFILASDLFSPPLAVMMPTSLMPAYAM